MRTKILSNLLLLKSLTSSTIYILNKKKLFNVLRLPITWFFCIDYKFIKPVSLFFILYYNHV